MVAKRKTWLIFDCHYLCYRSFYSLRNISPHGPSSDMLEIVFGFMRDVETIRTLHNSNNLLFCFDGGYENRKEIFPEYKANRRITLTKPEQEAQKLFHRQISKLRRKTLPKIGFRNVYREKGYEADDLIAVLCKQLPPKDCAIIVSTDKDLYQLLSKNILMWNPQKREAFTLDSFKHKYGILPKEWPLVKAIAGDCSDNIKGLPSIGEVTAIRFVRSELGEQSKAYLQIKKSVDEIKQLLKIIQLPMKGTPSLSIRKDNYSPRMWASAISNLERTLF